MPRRIRHLVRQFLGLANPESDPATPERILAAHQEALRKQLAHYNRSLAGSVNFSAVLKDQIRSLESKASSLRATLSACAQDEGDPTATAELALQLESLDSESAELRPQLEQAEATCAEITLARDAAIQAAERKLQELKGRLKEQQLRQALTQAIDQARLPD